MLFYRTTRHLRLTQEGQEFYCRSRELLEKLAELESFASTQPARLTGTLRVGISVPVSRLVVMPLVHEFCRKHPELSIEFVVLYHPKDLHAAGVDLLLRVSDPPDTGLIARELVRIKHAVFAAPRYIDEAGAPIDPDDLLRHRCLVLKPGFSGRPDDEWEFHRQSEHKTVYIEKPTIVTGDREGMIAAVVAGAGLMRLGFLDPLLITSGQLRRVLVDWDCPLSYSIYAMYRKTPRLAPKIAAFLEFAAAAFTAFDPDELTLIHGESRLSVASTSPAHRSRS